MKNAPRAHQETQPLVLSPDQAALSDTQTVPEISRHDSREFHLLGEAEEVIVVFERDGVEVQANLKPGGSEEEPYFIDTELQGRGAPLEDRFYMIVQELKVISLKGSSGEIQEGAIVAPAHIHPVSAANGLRIAIKGRS